MANDEIINIYKSHPDIFTLALNSYASINNLERVKYFFDNGVICDIKVFKNACLSESIDVVKFLIEKGHYDISVLRKISKNRNVRCNLELIDIFFNLFGNSQSIFLENYKHFRNYFFLAVESEQIDVVKAFNKNINLYKLKTSDKFYGEAMCKAANLGNLDIILELFYYIDTNYYSKDRTNPIYYSLKNKHTNCVNFLIDYFNFHNMDADLLKYLFKYYYEVYGDIPKEIFDKIITSDISALNVKGENILFELLVFPKLNKNFINIIDKICDKVDISAANYYDNTIIDKVIELYNYNQDYSEALKFLIKKVNFNKIHKSGYTFLIHLIRRHKFLSHKNDMLEDMFDKCDDKIIDHYGKYPIFYIIKYELDKNIFNNFLKKTEINSENLEEFCKHNGLNSPRSLNKKYYYEKILEKTKTKDFKESLDNNILEKFELPEDLKKSPKIFIQILLILISINIFFVIYLLFQV